MNVETNRQRLEKYSDEELATFLCYVIKSGTLTIDELSAIQAKYKDEKPADFESMVMWLNSPAY